jgi:hypothetical protein
MVLKGRTYKFVAPKGSTGIVRASVRESRTVGLFTVKVKVKQGWPPGTALFVAELTDRRDQRRRPVLLRQRDEGAPVAASTTERW